MSRTPADPERKVLVGWLALITAGLAVIGGILALIAQADIGEESPRGKGNEASVSVSLPTEPTKSSTRPVPQPSTPPIEPQVPKPPADLIGKWNGGPGDSSDWWLTIEADGHYTLINDRLGWSDSGTVDTSDHGFVMYNESGAGSVADPAGINGCTWRLNPDIAGVGTGPTLDFCDSMSTWLRS